MGVRDRDTREGREAEKWRIMTPRASGWEGHSVSVQSCDHLRR